ncbi:MAG: ribonuclease H-like domain-containing protein [Candidatus Aenigmatarchaeota archaeon]
MKLFLDIECTNNKADIGHLVAVGIIKGNKKEVKFVEDEADEKEVLAWLKEELKGCEMVITWYGSKFDIPFILSRAVVNGLDLSELSKIPSLDLCEFFRKNFLFSKNSLSEIAKILNIPKNNEISGKDVLKLYMKSTRGDEKSKKMIIEHCLNDLEVMEKIFEKISPYLNSSTKNP